MRKVPTTLGGSAPISVDAIRKHERDNLPPVVSLSSDRFRLAAHRLAMRVLQSKLYDEMREDVDAILECLPPGYPIRHTSDQPSLPASPSCGTDRGRNG